MECRIEITGKEKVTVPAGVFDCLRMNLQVWSQGTKALEHQLWFSQDAHRYLVKYDSTSALMELTGVSTASCKPTLYSNSNLAGTLTLPAGWFAYPYPEKENGSVITQLLSPEIGPLVPARCATGNQGGTRRFHRATNRRRGTSPR